MKKKDLEALTKKIPKLFNRKGKIKGHNIKVEFKRDAKMTQQKGRRVPLQLKTAVEAEIAKLIKEGPIRQIDKLNDEVFIQPTVITVKRYKTVKIALDAIQLNNGIQKDKYRMPNLDNLKEKEAEIIKSTNEESVKFTSLVMQYPYGQTEMHPDTAKHCNVQIIGGKARGTYTQLLQDFPA